MEFDIQGSLLFGDTQPAHDIHSSQGPVQIEDSLLFSQNVTSQAPPAGDFTSKKAKLLNGNTIFLKRRIPKSVEVDFSDTFLDMDKLHEKVERRRKLREALNEIKRVKAEELRKAKEALEKKAKEAKESLEKESLEKESLEKGSLKKESLEIESVEKEPLEKELLKKDLARKELLEKDSLKLQLLEKDSLGANDSLEAKDPPEATEPLEAKQLPEVKESLETKESLESKKSLESKESLKSGSEPSNKESQKTEYVPSPTWTEKYRPKSYFDLCPAGNERHYRHIMHWLRDKNREKKVLLVHGPSGVGKTSAVHLLAKHAKYDVYEVNAANAMDETRGELFKTPKSGHFSRTLAALRLRMKTALTRNSVTSNGMPTCLVIDEVDCADNAKDIVTVIRELVTSEKNPVRRPVICIANEAFGGEAMEKLRPLCELVAFRRPVATAKSGPGRRQRVNVSAQKAVKEYLLEISTKENLGMDIKEIANIFELCEGDMRACINQMQFSGRKLDEALSLVSGSSSQGLKDMSISWFALVDRLFARNSSLSKEEDFFHVFDMLLSGEGKSAMSGSLDKVTRACFNRYLEVTHLQDDSVMRPAQISDWLYYYDIFNSWPGADPAGYSALTPLKFWSLFSELDPPRNYEEVIVPNARSLDFECFELQKQNVAMIKTLTKNLPLSLKLALSGCASSVEFYSCHFLPLLDIILSPEIRSPGLKLSLTLLERSRIEKLALFVKHFELRLETQRDMETNVTTLIFNPNWDSVTMFETENAPIPMSQKSKVVNARRQKLFPLLQAEIEQAMAARYKRKIESVIAPAENKIKRSTRVLSSLEFYRKQSRRTTGEPHEPDQQGPEETEESQNARETARIWVKYHEGFSNAVRKNIGWTELWT
uniref:AAA+ ATPase domain-containing protein n=1 Tax=Candidozyma auris TaxID=498019 RepID=A0A0L0P8J7_CANAR